ncbi:MAG: hypothetical protein Q9164_001371 [Protoblastenia rupestris]
MVSLTPFEAIILPRKPGNPSLKYYVHAEIRLLAFYAVHSELDLKAPRVLGVSRSACYLCNLFIRRHGQFFISRTHGRLYDQWTVPDVFDCQLYQPQCLKFRQVLKEVNDELLRILPIEQQRARNRNRGRPWPIESDTSLLAGLSRSPLPSDAGTLLSGESSCTIGATTKARSPLLSIMPRAEQPNEAPQSPAQQDDGISEDSAPSYDKRARSTTSHLIHPDNQYGPGAGQQISPLISHASGPTRPLSPLRESLETLSPSKAFPRLHARKEAPSPTATIDSWEYPIDHSIKPGKAIKTNTRKLSITIEIESPAEGSVQITNHPMIDSSSIKHIIDVKSMRPNEEKHFDREDGEDDLILNLKAVQLTQVRLHWD